MKFKHIMVGFLASATLALGVGAGVAMNHVEAKEVDAAAGEKSDWKYVGSGQGNGWNQASTSASLYLTFTNQSSSVHSWKQFTFVANEEFKLMTGTSWGTDIGWSKVAFGDAKDKFAQSGTNIKCVTAGTYDVCVGYNGFENRIGIYKAGTLSNNLSTSKMYVLEKPNDSGYWVPSKVYAYGGLEQFNNFDAKTAIPDSASPTVNLAGEYGNIKTIEYLPLAGDDNFIIHNGNGYQSANTTITAGSAYYYSSKNGEGKVVLASSANLGVAADFITRAEAKRNAVVAAGDIKEYSVCGIAPQDAADLYNEYYGLATSNPTAKGYIDLTTITTYKRGGGDGNETVSYADIMAQLRKIAVDGGKTVSGTGYFVVNNNNSNNPGVIAIISITIISLVAIASFFVIHRRKENE